MIRSLPNSKRYSFTYGTFIICYFIFLFAPLFVTCVLAFNDSDFPSLPWYGFSLDWFVAAGPERIGIFNDSQNLRAIFTSFQTASGSLSSAPSSELAPLFCLNRRVSPLKIFSIS